MNSTHTMPVDDLLPRALEIARLVAPIQGWLEPNSGAALYQCARTMAPTPLVVELGSWKGRSTAWLGFAMLDRGGGEVVAVDTWAGSAIEPIHVDLLKNYGPDQLYGEFLRNIDSLGLSAIVQTRRMTTVEAARRWDRGVSIGLLHIDAGHSYADVRADFEFWSPFVVDGGYVMLDDVPTWPGPTRLVNEMPGWFEFVMATHNQYLVRKTPSG